ncbi:MAG: YesL family protein [Clostridiales bacterium]|nr:YesL family protein [Clostridiales bacterium]
MGKLFDSTNPFWTAMGRIFDVFVLNCLWLLCCLPIITIGPSTTALFYSLFGIVRGEGGYVSKDFFKSFRMNIKQGMLLGIPLTLLGAFLALDIYLCYNAGRGIYSFFLFFFIVIFILWASVTLYTLALLSKFERSSKDLLIWAFTLCIQNILKTFGMLICIVIALWVCHILPGLMFIVPGLAFETVIALFASILAPFLPELYKDEELEEDTMSASADSKSKDQTMQPGDDIDPWLL